MARDWRDERIAELEQLVEKLLRRIGDLEEQLGRNSSNSSQAPSKDTPEERRNRRKNQPSGKKRGAQPGHKAHTRALLPADQVDEIEDCYPDSCACCGAELVGEADDDPYRHQVLEMPRVRPDSKEYRLHQVECDDCGHRTRAELPAGVPRSMLGPRLTALVGLLTGAYHLSRRQAVTLLGDVLGVQISLGALSEAEERISKAIAPAVDEAVQFVRAQPIKHTDATGWSRGGEPRSLWTITTTLVTVFFIVADSKMPTVRKLLGKVQGWLVSDRAKQFGFWALEWRQICWAHLLRKFAGFAEKSGPAARIGRELHGFAELIFHYWHRVRDGTMTRAEFQHVMIPIRAEVEHYLRRGQREGPPGMTGSCADVLAHGPALWAFVDHEGIEPTNNLAERDLRPFVTWRKGSYGSQSERGERFAERIMTVVHTLRKQRRHVFDYLYAACANALSSRPPPSLLPSPQ